MTQLCKDNRCIGVNELWQHTESQKLVLSTNKHLKVITLVKVITNLDAIRVLQHSWDI